MFGLTAQLWTRERGPWTADRWDDIPLGDCIVRVLVHHEGRTFGLQGADNYFVFTHVVGLRFGQYNDRNNRFGLPPERREWLWHRGADHQTPVALNPPDPWDVRRGVWIPPDLDPYGIADGTVEP